MKFKVKLRKIGNSLGVIIPKDVITFIEDKTQVNKFKVGDVITLEVITDEIYDFEPIGVITQEAVNDTDIIPPEFNPNKNKFPKMNSSKFERCSKHNGVMKATCGCK